VVTLTSVRLARLPASGSSTSWTDAWSNRQTTTTGEARTASAAVVTSAAPCSTRPSALPGDRFHTVVRCPASTRAAARALPISPSPSTLTCIVILLAPPDHVVPQSSGAQVWSASTD
jgi:hypothetical protein